MLPLRTRLKRLTQRLTQPRLPAFVVASFGRSGSTLLYDALTDAVATHRFGRPDGATRRLVADQRWELEGAALYRGVVYKTHDFPEALARRGPVRAVFVFGSARDAALSVRACHARHGAAWIEEHFAHLHANGPYEALLERDVLRFEEQLQRWSAYAQVPVLCVRYDTLWEQEEQLAEFCGVPVALPPRRPRRGPGDQPEEVVAAAQRVYAPLDRTIASLPDAFLGGSLAAAPAAHGARPGS